MTAPVAAPSPDTAAPPAVAPPGGDDTVAFLRRQVATLGPFDFLIVNAAGSLLDAVEIIRQEDGSLRVAVPSRPTLASLGDDQRAALRRLGFTPEPTPAGASLWAAGADGDGAAAALAAATLTTLFGASALDVHHGSRRAEHEAQEKVESLRTRLVPLLTDLLGRPPAQDADGDYVIRYRSATVFVAPRAAPTGVVVLRVFAITNVGVTVGPELAMFLARLNFGLAFGRFTLDVEHQAVWFDESLLGDRADDAELRFAIEIVASTADEWDDRIKAMFGGSTGGDITASKTQSVAPSPKPGEGGYL